MKDRIEKRSARLQELQRDLVAAESEGDYASADSIRETIRQEKSRHTLVK